MIGLIRLKHPAPEPRRSPWQELPVFQHQVDRRVALQQSGREKSLLLLVLLLLTLGSGARLACL